MTRCRRHSSAHPGHMSPKDIDSGLSSVSSGYNLDNSDDDVFDYESDNSCTTTLTEPEPEPYLIHYDLKVLH